MFYQVLSIVGALLILAAFAGHQAKRLASESAMYQFLNLAGGLFLFVTAIEGRQYGFILMEGSWTLLSAWGLWTVSTGRGPELIP